MFVVLLTLVFFFKQKTAYELRISDWSSDVCSSDLAQAAGRSGLRPGLVQPGIQHAREGGQARRQPVCRAAGAGRRIEQRVEPDEIGRASCRERVCQYV